MCVGGKLLLSNFLCVCPFLFFSTIFPVYADFDVYYGNSFSTLAMCAVTSMEEVSLISEDI